MLTPAQDKLTTASAPPTTEGADNESVTPSEMSRTKKLANQTKEYLSDKVPKERREQIIWRLKKMIIEVQGHADCKQLGQRQIAPIRISLLTHRADQQAIETLLTMAEKYAGHTKDTTQEGGNVVKDIRSTDSVHAVENNLRVSPLSEQIVVGIRADDHFQDSHRALRQQHFAARLL